MAKGKHYRSRKNKEGKSTAASKISSIIVFVMIALFGYKFKSGSLEPPEFIPTKTAVRESPQDDALQGAENKAGETYADGADIGKSDTFGSTSEKSGKAGSGAASGQQGESDGQTALELARSALDTQVVRHDYYTIGFNHNTMEANWVAYYLSKARLLAPVASRTEDFREDEAVMGGSAKLEDYRRSGYDRGHLAPAADFKFSEEAMSDTFLLSNMAPQEHDFNAGVWAKLESIVRRNAYEYGDLYVATGPVFLDNPDRQEIGQSRVIVPDAFYKVLLSYNDAGRKAIGFIIPHGEKSQRNIERFAMSVDDVEKATGIDFFFNLEDGEEKELESTFDVRDWTFREYQK